MGAGLAVVAAAAATGAQLYIVMKTIQAVTEAMESVSTPSIPKHMPLSAVQIAKDKLGMDVTSINIGVTGNTKAGKSKLINTLRGLRSTDRGAAKVGFVETTTKSSPYPFPQFDRAVLWDMPGAGTADNKTETYFDDKLLIAYDIIIITYCDTVKEIDGTLAKALQDKGVPFFLVRSKADQVVAEGLDDGYSQNEIFEQIKQHARQQLAKFGVHDKTPFCISGLLSKCGQYDMLEFIKAVGESIAAERRKLSKL